MKKIVVLAFAALVSLGSLLHADEMVPKGNWTKKNYSVSGEWSIVTKDDGTYVLLDEDFKTRSAPDLKIFLSKKRADDLTNRNATDGAVRVVKLKSAKGAQAYKLPADLDLSEFQSILIHCERFSKLWAVSALR